jgi:two-component system OmpR family response regulator
MRILIAEDDQVLADGLLRSLRAAGYAADQVSSGSEADAALADHEFDCVILDLGLPKMHGLEVLKRLRGRGSALPVLILTARAAINEKVEGLEVGADDYMIKPFSFSELAARLHAITRRTQTAPAKGNPTTLTACDVQIDLLRRTVVRGDKKIELQPREFALLELLMRNPNRPLTKTLILERIWDYSFDPQTNIVDVLVCRLRNKIDGGFNTKLIQTMRGVGYVFRTDG